MPQRIAALLILLPKYILLCTSVDKTLLSFLCETGTHKYQNISSIMKSKVKRVFWARIKMVVNVKGRKDILLFYPNFEIPQKLLAPF